MNNKKKCKDNVGIMKFPFFKVLLIFFATEAVAILLIWIFMPLKGLYNHDWLTFWSGIVGGGTGGLATLIAIYLTIRQNDENNRSMFELQLELKRVDVIPYINVEAPFKEESNREDDEKYNISYNLPSGYLIFDKTVSHWLELKEEYKIQLSGFVPFIYENAIKIINVGMGTCTNVIIDLCNDRKEVIQGMVDMPFNLRVSGEVTLRLIFIDYPEGEYYLKFSTTDIYGVNHYSQFFYFMYKKSGEFAFKSIDAPKPIDDYSDRLIG
ncbi:hypothetical protein [Clostridium coskatii]|uniref:Uncharacterized protein n=1 Tax=Clostridium coskatii TaxID=1705578 RepID=A0A162LBD1_9CLOT|nr:hypothetical protein [Clostridium coskatii]OAA91326.1 hypothetical protein WX73_01736 [Clostridium coskatii]OBR93958.1 hypothetical protein CLCOS_20940 [Clostridium coskatii]